TRAPFVRAPQLRRQSVACCLQVTMTWA
ncbi:hypothetical protein D018_0852B, partial [Vibrio parahaemolyticus VP2007-007]